MDTSIAQLFAQSFHNARNNLLRQRAQEALEHYQRQQLAIQRQQLSQQAQEALRAESRWQKDFELRTREHEHQVRMDEAELIDGKTAAAAAVLDARNERDRVLGERIRIDGLDGLFSPEFAATYELEKRRADSAAAQARALSEYYDAQRDALTSRDLTITPATFGALRSLSQGQIPEGGLTIPGNVLRYPSLMNMVGQASAAEAQALAAEANAAMPTPDFRGGVGPVGAWGRAILSGGVWPGMTVLQKAGEKNAALILPVITSSQQARLKLESVPPTMRAQMKALMGMAQMAEIGRAIQEVDKLYLPGDQKAELKRSLNAQYRYWHPAGLSYEAHLGTAPQQE